MNKMKLTGVIGLVVFLILAACGGERGGKEGSRQFHGIENPQADSVIRTAWLAKDYPHLLVIADSLQQTGDLSPQLADILRGDVYLHLSDFAKSKEYYRRVTADHKPQAADIRLYQEAGYKLASVNYLQSNFEGALREAMPVLANVDSLGGGNEYWGVSLDMLMARCNNYLGRPREAEVDCDRAYQRAMQWLDRDSSNIVLQRAVSVCNDISSMEINEHRYGEAMVWVNRADSLSPAFAEAWKENTDIVDNTLALIALHRACAAQGLGQEADAERAYQAFCASNYAKTDNGILTRPEFLNLARRYAEAADCYAGVDRFMQQYGFDYSLERIGNLLIPKLRANLQAGRKDTALYVAGQITEVYDSALTRYKRSAAAELATVYDVQGKERQIAQQQNDLLRQRLWAIAIVLALVVSFFFMYDVYRRRARKRLAAEQAARERIESELRIARNIQMSMVPGYFPDREGLDLYAEMSPAKEVGGDLYGYVMAGDQLYFCVGDVSGKGVPASLFMAQAARLFHTLAKEGMTPTEIAFRMNNELVENNDSNMFVTMFIGQADLRTGQLSYCNCGHNQPVVDGEFLEMEFANMPLGLWEDFNFQGETVEDIRGRQLLVYTDGLNEAENPARERLGDDDVLQLMKHKASLSSRQVVDMLNEAVEKFRDGAEPSDDLTLMCLRVDAVTNPE